MQTSNGAVAGAPAQGRQRTSVGHGSTSRSAALVIALMIASQVINQIDRAVLAIAAPQIMREMALTPAQYGLLASAFYILHSATGIGVGLWLAHRVRPVVLVAWLLAVWTLVQLPPVIFSSVGALWFARVVLGAAEGPSVAASVAAIHDVFPPGRRSLPTSWLWIGSLSGGVAAPPFLTLIIYNLGWKAGFLSSALLSSLLCLMLLIFVRRTGAATPAAAHDPGDTFPESTMRLWNRPVLAMITAIGFCCYWTQAISYSWLYPMVRLHWGYNPVASGWIVSAIFLLSAAPLLAVSAFSQRLLKRNVAFRWAVVAPAAACLMLGAAALAASALLPVHPVKLIVLAAGVALMPVVGSTVPVMVSHVVPTAKRNRALMVVSGIMALSGLPAPAVTGYLIAHGGAHGYDWAFLCGAGVALAGGALTLALLRRHAIDPLAGKTEQRQRSA